MTDDGVQIKSTATCFEIIHYVQSSGGAGISELARAVGLSKSAVHKHVHTLSHLGYLVREGDDYHLSLRFLQLGADARRRLPITVVAPVVNQLAETLGHTTNFIARENDSAVYAIRVTPDEATVTDHEEGEPIPFHATAGGKAILAYLDADEQAAIIERTGLPEYTAKTITDQSTLERELQSVRDKRIAFDREEFDEGIQCVASPVLSSDQTPVGAVSVSGRIQYMSGKRLEEDVVGNVVSTAKTIEKKIRTTEGVH